MIRTVTDQNVVEIKDTVERMVRETFTHVTFTDVWVQARESAYGDEILEIWAIYDSEVEQLQTQEIPWFRVRVADALWDMGVDASPKMHFITKSDAGTGGLKASDFLTSAERQLPGGRGRPLESDLRRATSTVYYSLFHCLAKCCADAIVGSRSAVRSTASWRRAYRALDHRRTREACRQKQEMRSFPTAIRAFAQLFVNLQDERHEADYDPHWTGFKSEVVARIAEARVAIQGFEAAPIQDRRAFAAHVLFKSRR